MGHARQLSFPPFVYLSVGGRGGLINPPRFVSAQLNTEADPLAQIATAYTPAEIAYLKLIVRLPLTLNTHTHIHNRSYA